MIYDLPDLQATEALAKQIASKLQAGDALLLSGPLGAGKTAFSRALLRSVCGDAEMEVPSPSFTLVQIYESPKFPLYHYDLWRLEGADDLIELGWDEAREGVVIVEWPERLGDLTLLDALTIQFSLKNDENRQVILKGWEDRLEPNFGK
ncbi:MAG: tRNA (adenosine(37)-N6)-threonylcarbamoyltransferase complex ATPase subunit type 1 TsaE [Commensalibacter sp.]|nr:tRNA (adenosine(37)-N6)-threonylcarbamoyltransferase complex ATPase subunit type 1 TsaE [Commensalibacter sp.]